MGRSSVSVAFWVMVALHTIGSVDMPGKGERKMPSPRSYISIIALFSILGVIADAGAERAAAAAAWVTVLLGMIKGPFGNQLTNLFNAIAPPGPGVRPLQPIRADTSGGSPTVPYPNPIVPYPPPGGNAP
jgi:hypothetical protein